MSEERTLDGTLAQGEVEDDAESGGLVEEIADTATIEQLLDSYIGEVQSALDELVEVSLEGNPVRTHVELQAFGEDVVQQAFELRADLLEKLANRADQFAERSTACGQLRTQVVEDE